MMIWFGSSPFVASEVETPQPSADASTSPDPDGRAQTVQDRARLAQKAAAATRQGRADVFPLSYKTRPGVDSPLMPQAQSPHRATTAATAACPPMRSRPKTRAHLNSLNIRAEERLKTAISRSTARLTIAAAATLNQMVERQ
jgi:hypothetical protein